MLKEIVKCHAQAEQIKEQLRHIFDTVASKKCEYYVKTKQHPIFSDKMRGDYCDHESGDGYCAIDLCPLLK